MQYQGFYPKEAAELKQEYHKKVAAIKSTYAHQEPKAAAADAGDSTLLLAEEEPKSEAERMHDQQAREEGRLREEMKREAAQLAAERSHLKTRLHEEQAREEKRLREERESERHRARPTEPLLLAGVDGSEEEESALREAKQNYKNQMLYQGHYPKEAAELKQEYQKKVMDIKSKFAVPPTTGVFAASALVGIALTLTSMRLRIATVKHEPLLHS